jgi:hypothetical protein
MTGETQGNDPIEVPQWLVEALEREQQRVVMAPFRVYYGNEERIINMPVSAFVMDLKEEGLRAFNQGKQPARLWTYAKDLNMRLESLELYEHARLETLKTLPFADSLSLDLLPIESLAGNMEEMTVEIRYIRPGEVISEVQADFLTIPLASTISDLISIMYSHFQLPIGARIALYRKSPIITISESINLANLEHREKLLSTFCIFPGSILYLEEVISQLKRPRLPELMLKEAGKRLIRYTGKGYKGVLVMLRTDSLQDLKTRISESISLSESEFYLRKHSAEGEELRDLTDTLEGSGLVSGAELWVQEGAPASLETCRIELELASPACGEEDRPWFTYAVICELIVSLSDTISQLRLKAAAALSHYTGQSIPPEQLNLRERYGERPGKALADRLQLRTCVPRSGFKRLSIHILHKDYSLAGLRTAVPLSIRCFDPQTYALSAPVDLAVGRETTAGGLERLLAGLAGAKEVEICRVTFPQGFYRLDLQGETWRKIQGRTELISSYPLYLGERGGFLVMKDAEKPITAPSDDVLSKYPRPLSEDSPSDSPSLPEKSVKIHVKVPASLKYA